MRLLKLVIIGLVGVPCLVLVLNGKRAEAFREGPPTGVTGAPSESNCTECHFGGGPNTGGGTLSITGLPATYTAGQEITVTVTISQPGRSRFGFELTAINDGGSAAGTISVTDSTRTQEQVGPNGRMYILHTAAGTNPTGPGTNSWSFKWTAPATSTGKVTFYTASNAANNDGAQTGDLIYTTSASINPGQAAQPPVTTVSAASFAPNGPVAPLSIVAGFGANLATSVEDAQAQPLPTTLANGTTLKVKDSAGAEQLAGLFHVQGNQINYLIPEGTANGNATITVTSSDGTTSTGTVQVSTVAPGIFTTNFSGTGVPAGFVVRVKSDGSQVQEPISSGTTPVQIDLGPDGEQVILVIFGTGWRFRSDLSAVTAKIRGVDAQVQFAGGAPGFSGLDQTNILIPRSLAGANANADVVFVVNGQTANTVTINIK
jgi:uncharacterized protein (TIGR03437 family)